jgi:hypothetical protein
MDWTNRPEERGNVELPDDVGQSGFPDDREDEEGDLQPEAEQPPDTGQPGLPRETESHADARW